MSHFGQHWKRKMTTAFKRYDVDGDQLLTKDDFSLIADNIIKAGQFTGTRADEIKNNYMELWNNFLKPLAGGDKSTCEEFMEDVKSHSKSEIRSEAAKQFNLFFDAVDTNKDGMIQLQEFITFFNAIRVGEEFAKEAFRALDTNHDGVLSREEFVNAAEDFYTLEEPSLPADLLYGSLV